MFKSGEHVEGHEINNTYGRKQLVNIVENDTRRSIESQLHSSG